ncbi:MAG TPA: TetR family transcriptional regulator [Rhizomicrobium sp.]|jgi:AcrR family transcriptional regulator|nr:TetR family transcriptional regulator [Rhizomicrobium sp.]
MTTGGQAIAQNRARRRAQEQGATRAAILEAARKVGAREGARHLSLRAVAAEAGFAPAALYGYFRNKDELLLALAADDLSLVARAMREAGLNAAPSEKLEAAALAAVRLLQQTETIATAPAALSGGQAPDAERIFNGRLIAALRSLSDVAGIKMESRDSQLDTVLLAATLTGLAVMARSGRLEALGFSAEEIVARLKA